MRPASALAALTLALWAAPAAAAEGTGAELVVSLGAGVYVPTKDNGFVVNNPALGMTGLAVDALRPGVDLELALSAWWGLLGAQIGVGYLTASYDETTVDVVPVTALLRLRLPIGSFAPYLESGGGLCFSSATTPGLGGAYPAPAVSYGATSFEWIAGGGVELAVGPVRLAAWVRYVWVDRSALSSSSSVPGLRYATPMRFDLDGFTAAISAGYRFLL